MSRAGTLLFESSEKSFESAEESKLNPSLRCSFTGFGSAACTLDGRLYVTVASGAVLRLANDGKSWEEVGTMDEGRFFHQLVPIKSGQMIAIGGANMGVGKLDDAEVIAVEP